MLKKVFIPFTCFILLLTPDLNAQWQIGLKFNPGFTSSRLETTSDTLTIDGTYSGLRFSGGILFMNEFNKNYNFITGICFSPKRTGISARGTNSSFGEAVNIQYLQVPLSLKLFTNEVGLDKRVYFHVGGNVEVNIHDTLEQSQYKILQKISLFDLSLLLASGMDFKLGKETLLNTGLSYHRGLLNQFKDTGDIDIRAVIDFIGFDIGITF